ncbi:metallophosphoesterase [Spirochaeta thermophila DSM 6578]|uniref:Metallophosphoesterase n=1 Tax=Winmispira thermophila (strain ATCC 700085 / DSM 6578 / Z-1203) TaxID=869211 RepID=G0GEB4_WINT7|nr:metallophosphoesterase [Spirochaeta thermophila]AEJ62251.1 metallophosphoesterase [Spirochaeta thermophila DSM 6578]
MERVTIAHVSDPHISLTEEMPYGVDVKKNFLDVLDHVHATGCDLIVVTGDLCFRDASARVYHWVREALERPGHRFLVLAGNHDDPRILESVFPLTAPDLARGPGYSWWIRIGGWEIGGLDTSEGRITSEVAAWYLTHRERSPSSILFTHYPPFPCGVPHMDRNYALANPREAIGILGEGALVFCGHYHNDRVVVREGITAFLTPSTFFQIDPHSEDLVAVHTRGWREIVLTLEGIQTTVHWV